MGGLFQADLSRLFEVPSVWRSLVESLIVVVPLALALSGYANWRIGERRGLLLLGLVALYLGWMLLPWQIPAELVLPGQILSVLGWFWLLGTWRRQLNWHESLTLWSNSLVLAFLIALILTIAIAVIRNLFGWDGLAR